MMDKRFLTDEEIGLGQESVGAAQPAKPKVLSDSDIGFEPPKPSAFESVKDSAIALGTGVTQGIGMLANVAGADNAVSRTMADATQALSEYESPHRKAEKQERARKIKEAEESGSTLKEVGAYLGSFAEAPIDTTLNALGTSLPTLAAGFIPGAGQAAVAARVAQLGLGAAQGVGAVKGQIFDEVKQAWKEKGATEEDAAARAAQAQSYTGDNAGSIALGGALGAVAGSSGAEASVRRLVGKEVAERAAQTSVLKGMGMGALKEAPMEGLQGGQERLASNLALQNEGFDQGTWTGVAGGAALEATASAPMGAGFGAWEAGSQQRLAQQEQQRRKEIEQQAAQQQASIDTTGGTPPASDAFAQQLASASQAAAQNTSIDEDALNAWGAPPKPSIDTRQVDRWIGDDPAQPATPAPEAVRPSEAMGLRTGPDAGPLENAAALSVDSGLSDQMQGAAALANTKTSQPGGQGDAQQPVTLASATAAVQPQPQEPAAEQPAMTPQERESLASSLAGSDLSKASIEGANAQELQIKLDEVKRRAAENGSWNVPLMAQRRRIEDAMARLPATNPPQINEQQALQADLDAEQQGNAPRADRADRAFQAVTDATPAVSAAQPGAVEADGVEQQGPGADAGNGFKTGPKKGERYRVSVSPLTGGVVLEKRLPGGTAATFYVGKDGGLVDADAVNLVGTKDREKLWTPTTPEQASQATAILDEMGRLDLTDPKRADAKRRLKSLVTATAAVETAAQIAQPESVAGEVQRPAAPSAITPTTTQGNADAPQTAQAQQAVAQPAQVGAAPTVPSGAPVAQGRAGAQGDQQPAAAAGLTDAATTPTNPGAQAAPAAGAQAQARGSEVEALRQQLRDVEDRIIAAAPSAMGQGGGDIEAAMTSRKVPVTLKAQRKKLADQIRAAKSEEVQTFAPEMRAAPTQQADGGKPLMERAGTSAPTAQGSSPLPRDQSGNEGVPTTSPAAQQAAVHEEPGQAPQTATPSVVGQSIAKAAGNQEASPAQMRNWLFGEIDKAIASAPEVATGFLTFDVPGDGSFKVVNSTAKLQEFRKRVAASPGFRQERGGQPQGVADGAHKGSASTVEAIKNMLADGDIQAAVEYAGAKGVEFHLVPPQLKVSPNGGKARHIPASVKSTPAGVAEGLTQLESESIHQWLQSEQQRASTTVPSTNNATDTVAQQSPQDFIPAPDGGLDYGEITPDMGKAMRRQAGKIRLRRGDEKQGLVHIEQRHNKDFAAFGFDSAVDFIAQVAKGFNKIYKGRGAALDVVIDDDARGMLIVSLEASPDGDFYDIKTATPIRRDQFKNEEPLWERAGPSASTADESSPPSPWGQNGIESVPPTAAAAQPITRADVTAAQQQAAAIIGDRIDAMSAGSKFNARQAQEAGFKAREEAKKAQRQAKRTQAAPEDTGLRVGVAPGSADPVTVRDGVVLIGDYEAVNYDTGEPVIVPKGSTRADVAQALKNAGALSSRQKMFGLGDKAQDVMFSRTSGTDQTETAAFKRWFGDGGVRNSDGDPQVFYHGGAAGFSGIRTGGRFGGAIFVREGAESGYGEAQHALYLNSPILELDEMRNLLDENPQVLVDALARDVDSDALEMVADALTDGSHYPDSQEVWDAIGAIDEADAQLEMQKLRGKVARALGFAAVRTPDEFDGETVMVLEAGAIKSATGNNGDFDPANPDIRRSATAQPPRTPAATIRAAINHAYGKLLGQLEAKGLVTLVQTEAQAIEAAAQARAKKTGGDVAQIKRSLTAAMQGGTDLDIKRSANDAVQGFFDPQAGQSFLIADNLSAEAAPGVLMHEVGIHMAADGSMKALFNRAATMLKMQKGNPFTKAVRARMDAAGETSGEEAAAYIAEAYENDRTNAPASVQRWLADLLAAVKAWMFKKGIMGADRLTVADIAAVARSNARSMARGGGATGWQGFGPAFSVGEEVGAKALAEFAKADELFALPKSTKDTVEGIAADNDAQFTVSKPVSIGGRLEYTVTLPDGTKATLSVREPNPFGGEQVYDARYTDDGMELVPGRPGENPDDVPPTGDVWIDVSDLKKGDFGAKMYNIAATYAHNTGRIFIGDPHGLSKDALRRRLEQMISSALKFGTTAHLAPHPDQTRGGHGVPPLRWVYGDHVGNVERMIAASVKALDNGFPQSKLIEYRDGNFYNANNGKLLPRGRLATGLGESIAQRRSVPGAEGGTAQAGWRTVARAALFRHFQSSIRDAASGIPQRGSLLARGGKDVSRLERGEAGEGAFDANERIFYSRTAGAGSVDEGTGARIGAAIKSVTVTNIKQKAGFKLTDYLGIGLQALGRRQIVDIYGDLLPLSEYNRLVQQMEADKNEGGAEADQLVTRWAKLPDEAKLADLMHDATLAQIDPDKPYVDGDDKAKFMMLQGRFKALSDDAKAVYRATRDAYRAHHANVRSAINARIERSEIKGERKAALLKQMDDEFFKAVKGVYFPLARFGQYAVTVKGPDGKVESVSRAETKAEAEALRSSLLAAFPREKGFTVGRVMLSKDFIADRDAVGRGFMTELYQVLDKQDMDAAQRAELEDTLGQLYLSSLPDLSWAKHGIHRKGTPGFSQDARRAFAQNMFHGARYLAKLRYSDLMQDELAAMQRHVDEWREVEDFDQNSAQRVVDEMNKRHESLMNPKSNPLSTALTSLGFVFHLGLSPASAMVNLSQTALVAYPIMGAKWGFGKASAALLKASKQAAEGKNDITGSLNADELAAYNEAVRAGTIDVTMAHDLAGIAQGEDAGVMWKIRPVMRWASFFFHHAERFNRQVTFVAAYRLAREAGADQKAAFEQATKATYDGHFDYSSSNRPRIMQGNVAKVLLLFKQYGQNMVYTLSRNAYQSIKGTDAEKAEARKALAGLLTSHAMAAGVLGLPMVTTLLAAASMIGGDDDEPWDAKVALQNMLADTFGQKTAEVLAHGLSRLTPWDISGRVGLDRLIFPDVQEGLEGQRLWESAATQALGPVGGIFGGALKGLDLISDGHYLLGLEAMLPAVLRQGVKSIRYATEGAQDKGGVVIKDEVSMPAVVGQLLGFSPSEVRLAQEGKSAIYQHDKALAERRQELLTKISRATMAKDEEAKAEAREEIRRFNEKNPGRRINPNHIMASVRGRQKRIDQAQDGVYLPKSRRDAMQAGRFAFADSE